MSSGFSPDKADPPTRFRATAGQMGTKAALQGLRQQRRPGPKPSGGASGAGVASPGGAPSGSLGLPGMPEEAPGDNRHLVHALHHANIQSLGRNIPFGLWAIHNGRLPEVAPGSEPFDWLEHA